MAALLHLSALPPTRPSRAASSKELAGKLIIKSRGGLALGRVLGGSAPYLEVRFFDGRTQVRRLTCCQTIIEPVLSRKSVAMFDSGVLSPAIVGRVSGSQLVIVGLDGNVTGRSAVRFTSSTFALSPNQKEFAFVGSLTYPYSASRGLFVAEVNDPSAQRLLDLPPVTGPPTPKATPISVDWSADGTRLLFSDGKDVLIVNATTGGKTRIGEGSGGRWAPYGNRFTYLNKGNVILADLDRQQSKQIMPGREPLAPPVWSPDGDYLLVLERHTEFFPQPRYGRYGVYRLSDGAFSPIPDYAVSGPRASWIQASP